MKNPSYDQLKQKVEELEGGNTALRVLLDQREREKKKLEGTIVSNVKELLTPSINRLKNSTLSSKQQTNLNVLEYNLNEIVSPFMNNVPSGYMKLTPTEIRIANFIKVGLSSKEISDSLGLSQRTVSTHRFNIRKKLGVIGTGVDLRTYLLSLT